LDPAKYNAADNLIIFLGIASYIAERRGKQDRKGNMITHILDSKIPTVPREKRRGIHSNIEIDFHTDVISDILALQVRQTSKHGGETLLSPTWTVYNTLATHRPDIIRLLSEPIWPAQM